MSLSNVAITASNNAPVTGNKGVLAYDLTTGALVTAVAVGTIPASVLYRADHADVLVLASGATDGGVIYRFDLSLSLLSTTVLAATGLPSTDLWFRRAIRADHHGGLFVTYQPSPSGTDPGDQLLRQIDPVSFLPLTDWRTFLTPDSRGFLPADFSLDGTTFYFGMRGGGDLHQNVIYQLPVPPGTTATTFATIGTYSGGVNPTGTSFTQLFLRPRPDGTFAVADFHETTGTTDGVNVRVLAANGSVAHTWPVTFALSTSSLVGMDVTADGTTAYLISSAGALLKVNLLTGTQTNLSSLNHGGADLALIEGATPPAPPDLHTVTRAIRLVRQSPHLWDNTAGHRLTYPGFQLLVNSGTVRADNAAPLTFGLQWSDDGGHTWSNLHVIEGARQGQHRYRFFWRRLGQSRDRVFRVINTDDAPIALIDALLTPDPVEGSS